MVPLEGPVGVGALVDAIMLGCAIVQSCVYYKNSGGDKWMWKILVSLFLFLLLSHLGCTTTWLWASAEASSEDTSVPKYATIVFGISTVFAAIILFLERCFFSHRVLKTSQNHVLTFAFFIFCIFTFTAALGAASIFFSNTTVDVTTQLHHGWVFPLVIISGLLCDLAISIAIAFYLKSQTPTEAADTLGLVSRLILLVAETSCITSLFNVASVIVYWSVKPNFAWVGLAVAMPGVFVNTFLAALNARGRLCADIEHQRTLQIGEQLIDDQAKKPPIMITISKKVEKRAEKHPV